MPESTLSRRSFVKTATVVGAAFALGKPIANSLVPTDQAWAETGVERKMFVTSCHGCITTCPCRVYTEDGVVVKIEGDPRAPVSKGSLCLKGLNQIHTCYSPRRVLYPLKRVGARGAENAAWERVSWDEAVQLAAEEISKAIRKYGTYAFFSSVGGGGSYSFIQANSIPLAFGSPTVFEPGCAQCYLPRLSIGTWTYAGKDQSISDDATVEAFKGFSQTDKSAGIKNDMKVLVLWATQPSISQTAAAGHGLADLRESGCKTVVIDPNLTPDAAKADVWLRVRPATDTAMLLGWYRYIFEHNLYNAEFTKYWTNLPFVIDPDTKLPLLATEVWPDYQQSTPANTPAYVCFDLKTESLQAFEFGLPADAVVDPEIFWSGEVVGKKCRTAGQIYKDTAEPFTLEKVDEICWVPPALTEKAIRLYTDSEVAGIGLGVATDMEQVSSQVPLGTQGLDMIMGYINRPGATMCQTGGAINERDINIMLATGAATMDEEGNITIKDDADLSAFRVRPTTQCGLFGVQFGTGWAIGATKEENEARIAEVPDKNFQYIYNQLLLDRLGMKDHKGLHTWEHSHIPSVRQAIETGLPYRPRVWFDMSGNKLAMLGNAESWYKVFPEIDFCICQYPMITSFQQEQADIIFPLGEWLEFPEPTGGQLNYVFGEYPVVHLGETVPNSIPSVKVVNAASKLLNEALDSGEDIVFGAVGAVVGPTKVDGQESSYYHEKDYSKIKLSFPVNGIGIMSFAGVAFEQESQAREAVAGFYGAPNFEELSANYDTYAVNVPKITPSEQYWVYGQHLNIANDGLPVGFGTESRKCEVYCQMLIKLAANGYPFCYPLTQEPIDPSIGLEIKEINPDYEYVGTYSPICQYIEPAESPLEGAPGYDPEYPLVITSGRVPYFHHGTMRHAAFARELYPVPDVRMNPKTAERYGLKHLDWVKVTSRRSSTNGRVYVTNALHEKVIWMERFWNPECFDNSVPQEKRTGGWRECNINVITKNTAPFNEVFGSYTNRGFTVKIEKTEKPEGVWVAPEEFEPFLPTNANHYVPDIGSAMTMDQNSPTVAFTDWIPK
jgi:anaerobic selenocysteine-containing dehydrogenase